MTPTEIETFVRLGAANLSPGGCLTIDQSHFRQRRGKWVLIPAEWYGKVPRPQQIRQRWSKLVGRDAYLNGGGLEFGRGSDRIPRDKRNPHRERRNCRRGPGHPRNWAPRKVFGRFDHRMAVYDSEM